jgi:hypothetical protein
MEEGSVTKVLDGRVALVTGAGRGLGLEIAKGLAVEGNSFGEWAELRPTGAGRR